MWISTLDKQSETDGVNASGSVRAISKVNMALSQALDSEIFPNSVMKQTVYRGMSQGWSFAGPNQTIFEGWVFFTSDREVAELYKQSSVSRHGGTGKVITAKVNLQQPFYASGAHNFRDEVWLDAFIKSIDADEFRPIDPQKFLKTYKTCFVDVQSFPELYTSNQRDDFFSRFTSDELAFANRFFHAKYWFPGRWDLEKYVRNHYDGIIIASSVDKPDNPAHDQVAVFSRGQVAYID